MKARQRKKTLNPCCRKLHKDKASLCQNITWWMFAVQNTSPFTFNIGGLYKHKLSHGGNSGFHVGGGLGLGTVASTFGFSVAGVAGIHYNLPGTTDLVLHVDAGPVLTIIDGSATFALSPFSGIFGATLVYMF